MEYISQLVLTIQPTQSQHLNSCTFNLFLPTTRFGHSFDHHQEEKYKYNKEKCYRRGLPFCSILPFRICIFLRDDVNKLNVKKAQVLWECTGLLVTD